MDEQKLIHDPSQKVLAMYQAVIEFINEGCDINTLKVADITGRAGIGKGTAYEYFSSKEEIISSAILYYVKVCFEKLQVISTDNRTFQQKINEVMDFIDEHVKEKQGVFFLIKMVLESYEIPKNLKDEYERGGGCPRRSDPGGECFPAKSRGRNPAFGLFYVPHRSREKNGA